MLLFHKNIYGDNILSEPHYDSETSFSMLVFPCSQTVQVIEANLPLFGAQFSKQALQFRLAICSWEVRVGQPIQS